MTPSKTNSEILSGVYWHGVREGKQQGSRSNIVELPNDELTIATALKLLNEKDKVILEREAEIKRLKGQWQGTTAVIQKGVMKPEDFADYKYAKDKIQELEKELASIRSWSMAAFGTTHPEMHHDPKPTYTELEKELAVAKIAISNDEENIRRLYEAEKELETLKSYSTGEVELASECMFDWIAHCVATEKEGRLRLDTVIEPRIKAAFSSIHQKYRGELGEVREAIENSLEESVDRMCHPNRVIYGLSSKEEDAIKLKDALTKLTKLINEK